MRGRRAGPTGTREEILDAARRRFAERGFEGATIRAIAADAGVDPALVHHFYGTKEELFVASLRFPALPSDVLRPAAAVPRRRVGDAIARAVLQLWEDEATRSQGLALLRSAFTNEQAATMLREFVGATILSRIASLAVDDAAYRAALVGSQIVGLAIARYVVAVEPLASAHPDDVVAALGPTIQRYLTGPVRHL